MPPSNHSNKTVPDGFFCLPMASVSGMPPLHSRHPNKPNRYCSKLCHGTCESPRFLLRCFYTNRSLPSAQGPVQHVQRSQLPWIHGHPGACKISEFQNSRAKNWIPEGVQYIECAVGRTPENVFSAYATLVATQGLNILNPGLLVLCCCLIMIQYSNNPEHTSASLFFNAHARDIHSFHERFKKMQLVTACTGKVHKMGCCYHSCLRYARTALGSVPRFQVPQERIGLLQARGMVPTL